ncbi:tripartite motif-containing protein 16-like [Pundamilia nyererei]|uniref:Tripartite motif-containing protein 16-like n=1 Tax=Pundamilia nyererei TaxID=303518 RepID=A0A9Y6MC17_9CICH|nr:PREDICTED: tripartite motif-containing protein 16-like [Pundamilia nyererei]
MAASRDQDDTRSPRLSRVHRIPGHLDNYELSYHTRGPKLSPNLTEEVMMAPSDSHYKRRSDVEEIRWRRMADYCTLSLNFFTTPAFYPIIEGAPSLARLTAQDQSTPTLSSALTSAVKISAAVVVSVIEPKTRAEFLKYSHEITLDPNTANTHLLLSEGNRKVTRMKQQQFYSDHPDRFADWCFQVLSRESLTKRCYWEVEWRGGEVCVAVTCKNISRVGSLNECVFGFNDKSWALYCYTNSYQFLYNSAQTVLSGPRSSRVGVYLDHRAGILSFYSVSETMTLLHRVQTTFTQPLYAGLYLYGDGFTSELIKVK